MKQVIRLVTFKWNQQMYTQVVKTARLSDIKEMNILPKTTQGG